MDSHKINCNICNKRFNWYGLLGGDAICDSCYKAFYYGFSKERKFWEEYTGTKFLTAFHELEKKKNSK